MPEQAHMVRVRVAQGSVDSVRRGPPVRPVAGRRRRDAGPKEPRRCSEDWGKRPTGPSLCPAQPEETNVEKPTVQIPASPPYGSACALHAAACPGGFACPYYAELLASTGEIGSSCSPGAPGWQARPHPVYGHMLRAPWWVAVERADRIDRGTAA
jgi:hypothetical protein